MGLSKFTLIIFIPLVQIKTGKLKTKKKKTAHTGTRKANHVYQCYHCCRFWAVPYQWILWWPHLRLLSCYSEIEVLCKLLIASEPVIPIMIKMSIQFAKKSSFKVYVKQLSYIYPYLNVNIFHYLSCYINLLEMFLNVIISSYKTPIHIAVTKCILWFVAEKFIKHV